MASLQIDLMVQAVMNYLRSSETAVFTTYVALFGTLFTFAAKAIGQAILGYLTRRHAVLVTRTALYAEIRRTRLTTQGHIDFATYDQDGWNGMIWIVVFPTLFPTSASLARIGQLSAREVRAITSFLFVYKETIGFLKASAMEILPLGGPGDPPGVRGRDPYFELDMDMIEYVYSNGAVDQPRRRDLIYRLGVIEQQAEKAISSIGASVMPRFGPPLSPLARLMRDDARNDAGTRAARITRLAADEAKRRAAPRPAPPPPPPLTSRRDSARWASLRTKLFGVPTSAA